MTRVRTWAPAVAGVAALAIAGLVTLVTPTLGASPASQDGRSSLIRLGADGPRGVTPVGDPEVRARFGRKPNVVVVMTDDMRADDLRWMPTVRR